MEGSGDGKCPDDEHIVTDDVEEPKPKRRRNGEGQRTDARLETCKRALKEWLVKCWKDQYEDTCFHADDILPTSIINKLAQSAHITMFPEMKVAFSGTWDWIDIHGEEILRVVLQADRTWLTSHQEAIETNRQLKKARTAAAAAEKRRKKKEEDAIRKQQAHEASRREVERLRALEYAAHRQHDMQELYQRYIINARGDEIYQQAYGFNAITPDHGIHQQPHVFQHHWRENPPPPSYTDYLQSQSAGPSSSYNACAELYEHSLLDTP